MRTKRLGIAVLLSAATLSWAPSPASAHSADVCGPVWVMVVSPSMYYPGLGPSASGGIAIFSAPIGGCWNHVGFPVASLSLVNGVLPAPFAGAWCGAANGGNGSLGGHGFSMTWVGKTMTFAGSVTGTLWVEEGPNESCASGAGNFLLSGFLYVSP